MHFTGFNNVSLASFQDLYGMMLSCKQPMQFPHHFLLSLCMASGLTTAFVVQYS